MGKLHVAMIADLPAPTVAGIYTSVGRTAMKARSPVANDLVYLIEGKRSGLFVVKAGAVPFLDENESVYVASNTAGFYYERDGATDVNFLWCGAIEGDNPATDNWAQWVQAIRFCGLTGRKLYIPAGRYRFIQNPNIDMTSFYTQGLTIYGDGHARSILDLRSVATSPNMSIYSTTDGSYFLNMRDLSIIGNIPGLVLQIGQTSFSDPPNIYRFTGFNCQNFDPTGNARAVEMNFVVGGFFDWQVNCGSGGYVGGFGTALTLRQCAFNYFFGSMGSAEIAVLFKDGHSFGNVFTAPDFENVKICVRFLAGGNYNNNTFIGGQWSYSFKGIDCQAGTKTIVDNPTQTYNAPAGPGDFIGGAVGLTVR